ncbi:unnamed protein product, partial [Rotaria socialis]
MLGIVSPLISVLTLTPAFDTGIVHLGATA